MVHMSWISFFLKPDYVILLVLEVHQGRAYRLAI
jgi:hypothetical protein